MNKLEKKVLTKIFENHLIVEGVDMTISKLAKITDNTEKELYKIISILLIKGRIRMIDNKNHWTVNPFAITEKGLKVLEFPWQKTIQNFFIGLATFVSIIALYYNQQ